jgi:preprotein translocase subunit SecD
MNARLLEVVLRPGMVLRFVFLTLMLLVTGAAAEPLTLDVRAAEAGYDIRTRLPILKITVMNREALGRFSRDNIGRKFALRIDGETVLETVIREPLLGGSFQISGPTDDEVRAIAQRLSTKGARVQLDTAPN